MWGDACLRYGWINPLLYQGLNPACCKAGLGESQHRSPKTMLWAKVTDHASAEKIRI